MTVNEHRTIARIVRVNHAGEYGAIRIYRAQIWIARRLYKDELTFLEDALGHELTHCEIFRAAMPARQSRPCRIMALWGNGDYILGFLAALLGRRGIWVCTAAVEATVHRHLKDQLRYLDGRDQELQSLILSIQAEELQHLNHAEAQMGSPTLGSHLLGTFIAFATDTVIWLSTWGDSARMAKAINSHDPH